MSPLPPSRNPARRIVLVYVLTAAAWILLSDRAVALVAPDVARAARLSTIKGWAFVAFTATLLYAFIRRSFRQELATRETLAASEARFAKAFQSNPSPGTITREADGLFVAANERFCALIGLPLERILGRTPADLALYVDPGARARILADLLAQGFLRDVEVQLRSASGEAVDVVLSIERILLEGEPCILTSFHDVTSQKRHEAERQRLEAEVQHVHKLESLGTLAGGIAHDMNNILGAVMGVASLVQEQHQGDPGLAGEMATLLRAAARGRDLVKGLTDFARKDLQEPSPTDLNELLSQEAELLRRTTRQKVEITLDLHPDLPPVMGDAGSLSNALMNLCVNAVDAMPEGGQLRLASRVLPSAEVQVAVVDTGNGMPPGVLKRATDPFFTTKPKGKGTGLGLSLAYSIVQAHHGRMEIRSEPGRGTEVLLRFPPLAAPGGVPVHPQGTPPKAVPREILLVDDDDLLRATIPSMLEARGHRVTVADSGREALSRLSSAPPPALVLLDVNMPGMDGLEVFQRLREHHPRLPVLFITGLKDPRLDDVLQSDPAVGYLPKPFTLAELEARLAALPAP
ncbi:MAG TPA: response regulator [Holophagaceae bacterium]